MVQKIVRSICIHEIHHALLVKTNNATESCRMIEAALFEFFYNGHDDFVAANSNR
jgi:hypothetical protein